MSKALRVLARFLGELIRAQHRDQLLLRAGALAYTALLSLVPLLTVVLVTVSRVQPERFAVVVQAIATVLPFSPARVQTTLTAFAERTAALGWIAVAISVALTFNAFYQIEEVINDIWGVPKRRRWQWRLVSFAMVLLWGPLLLLALGSGLYWLSSRQWYPLIAPIGRPLPAILGAVVLAALYRWVPHTRVTWRAASTGAAVGAVALTVIHIAFQTYLARRRRPQRHLRLAVAALVLPLLAGALLAGRAARRRGLVGRGPRGASPPAQRRRGPGQAAVDRAPGGKPLDRRRGQATGSQRPRRAGEPGRRPVDPERRRLGLASGAHRRGDHPGRGVRAGRRRGS